MPGEIVASNELLKERSEDMRTLFDSAHALRLFTNDFKPTPASKIGDFAEATFPGYAAVAMAGKWKPVFKVIDGEYQFSSKEVTWQATAANQQLIFGWYLTGSGKVKLSCRLPFGHSMNYPQRLTVRVDCQTWAASILIDPGDRL